MQTAISHRFTDRWLRTAVAVSIAGASSSAVSASQVADDEITRSLRALHASDARVAATAYRLLARGAPLCSASQPLTGLTLHDASQYDASIRHAARGVFGLAELPVVAAVAPGSPAEAAAVRPGDEIVAIETTEEPRMSSSQEAGSYTRVAATLGRIEAAASDGVLTLSLARASRPVPAELQVRNGCASQVQLVPSRRLDAGADGRIVTISTRLEARLPGDALAVVLAHEIAHNALRHGGRNSHHLERAADRVAVFFLALAGYDPGIAERFWQTTGRGLAGGGLLGNPAHPGWKTRAADSALAANEIAALRAAGQPLRPSEALLRP